MGDFVRTKPGKSYLPTKGTIDRLDETVLWYVECHARLGATDKDIARLLRVHITTIDYWKRHRPEFLEALNRGKQEPDDRVERSLFERAVGYSHPDTHITHYKGTIIQTPYIKHYPPDTAACIVWLRNRRKEQWSETMLHKHEHKGTINHKKVEDLPLNALTADQKEMLFQLNLKQIEGGDTSN